MIDPTLDYHENNANVEEQAHKRLFLKPAKRGPEEEEKEIRRIVKAYWDIAIRQTARARYFSFL